MRSLVLAVCGAPACSARFSVRHRQVANIKCDLLNDFATANKARRDAVLADDDALDLHARTARTADTPASAVPAAGAQNECDDQILGLDEEFEKLVGGE